VHCIKSELYLAKWKWILRSGPKLKMLVKFHCSNSSFPNPLNWWWIRFGCTALDQCYWNKGGFAEKSTPDLTLLQLNIKGIVLCIHGDSTARHQITKLRLWPLDHSSFDVWYERERLNITYELGYSWLSLRHFYKPNASPRKQIMPAENHSCTLTKRFSTYWRVQCLSLLNFLSK
jgi:hypothetical protein